MLGSGKYDQLLHTCRNQVKRHPLAVPVTPCLCCGQKQAVAPFLYGGGLTPTLNTWLREPLHLLLRHLNQVSP